MNKSITEADVASGAVALRTKKRRGRWLLGVGLLALAAGAIGYGAWWRGTGRWIESTDDAYVGGNVTALAPRVAGQISQILVDDNQRVAAGQLLLRLDPRSFQATLDRAQAISRQQQASLDNLHAQYAIQKLAIRRAQSDLGAKTAAALFARQDLARYQSLAKTAAGSVQNAQKAVASDQQAHADADGAQAALNAAQEQLGALDAQISATQAAAAAANADVESARLNLEFTDIRSPVDGFIGNRAAQVGSYVNAGAYLLTVVPTRDLWVDANFKEDQLARMRLGQSASVTADVAPGVQFRGRIVSFAPATGATFSVIPPENATGNFTRIVQRVPVRIFLDGDGWKNAPIRPGLSTVVTVDTASK